MNVFPLPARAIRSVEPRELEPLVSARAQARVLALADQIPLRTATVCYECRLAEHDTRVDFAIALFPAFSNGVESTLAELRHRHRQSPTWARCLDFLEAWIAGTFHGSIPFVCVAFDLEEEPTALPVPCLSVCVDANFFAKRLGIAQGRALDPSEVESLAETCYQRLRGESLPAAARGTLGRCLFERDGADARHVSFMLSREPSTSKLDLKVPVGAIKPLLNRIGWSGDTSRVSDQIRELMPSVEDVQLNVIIDPAPGPLLEVEFLANPHEIGAEARTAFLGRLVDRSLCSSAKAEVLRSALHHPLTRGADLTIARSWYVKVRFSNDGPVDAKAYLGLMPRILGST